MYSEEYIACHLSKYEPVFLDSFQLLLVISHHNDTISTHYYFDHTCRIYDKHLCGCDDNDKNVVQYGLFFIGGYEYEHGHGRMW